MRTIAVILALAAAAPVALVACDRTIESQSTKTTDNGGTKVEKKTVTESPGGDVTVAKEKKTVSENP